MNISGNVGESSSKRQENGDATRKPDRPLKKARFAWEVKGKYHLRNEISDGKASRNAETDRAGSSKHEPKLVGNTEQNLEILGDYLLKQDFNSLDSISDNNASLMPNSVIPPPKLSYPRYIGSFETSRGVSESRGSSNSDRSVPNAMVYTYKDVEDQCIARWQAKQMAKCFVDNTINRVLDSWMIAPLPTTVDNNRVVNGALDAAEFINNLPGDNTIENEAILMAISAHGLQNKNKTSGATNDTDKALCNPTKHLYISPSSSPLRSDDEVSSQSNIINKQQTNSSANDLDMSWTFTEEIKQDTPKNSPIKFYPDTSSSSCQYLSETDNMNSSNGDENEITRDNDIVNNHYEFLDAAVTFAIQCKGLTSYGNDYG